VETVANWFVLIAAVAFLVLGGYLAFTGEKTASATAVLTVACFLVLLVVISKLKHVKGFGFEGETWDQEQVKAAELRKSLSEISEILSQQVSLIAAKVGYWDSALSLDELMDIIAKSNQWLQVIGISKERKDEILLPVYRRVEQYYWNECTETIRTDFAQQQQALQARLNIISGEKTEERQQIQAKIDADGTAIACVQAFTLEKFRETNRLNALIDILTQNPASSGSFDETLRKVNYLNDDLLFFIANRRPRPINSHR
jgi:hypothetical protein